MCENNANRSRCETAEYPRETEYHVGNLCRRKSKCSSSKLRDKIGTFCHSTSSVAKIKTLIPVLQWLPEYKWKDCLYGDFVAGCTVASMLIPQSAAFAVLAGVPTNIGMYTASIAAFTSFIFSTARHANIGPITIVSLMVAESATRLIKDYTGPNEEDAYLNVVYTLSFTCGIFLILVSLCQFGNVVSTMLSDPVMSAVTCAGATLVLTSQIGSLLGISVPRHPQPLQFFYSWVHILGHLNEIHWQTMVTGVSAMAFILLVQAMNKKYKYSFPLPVELLAVVLFTTLSALIDENSMGVRVVGKFSSSLPKPTLPNFDDGATFGNFAQESIGLVVVICMLGLSIAKIFSNKFGYYFDSDREVFAYGMSNLVGSFFMCYPSSTSMSRSSVLATVGCHSPLYHLFSGSLMLLIATKLSFLMEELPYACLSAIVVVALRGLLMQATRPKELWDIHREDSVLWLISFTLSICFGMQWGTIGSMIFNAALVLWRVSSPSTTVLGLLEGTEVYRSSDRYSNLRSFPGIVALRLDVGELSHLNRKQFEESIKSHVTSMMKETSPKRLPCFVVLDITAVVHVDTSSLSNLQDIDTWLKDHDIKLLIVGSKYTVRDAMVDFGLTSTIDFHSFFPRMHSAVEYAISEQQEDDVDNAVLDEKSDNTEEEC